MTRHDFKPTVELMNENVEDIEQFGLGSDTDED